MGTLAGGVGTNKGAQPVLGMVSFATGLASPFFFLAAFPSLPEEAAQERRLAGARQSGDGIRAAGRDAQVRLSNIDQVLQTELAHPRAIPRRLVRAVRAGRTYICWACCGSKASSRANTSGIGRLLVASVFLIFAFSLLPGMFGAPLGELDAYVPAPPPAASCSNRASTQRTVWMKNQYREALDQGRARKTSWCWSTSPATPAPTATG